MPKRPGGGEPPPESIEQGLRDLVLQVGPDIRKLSRGETVGLQTIMRAARPPDHWPIDVKAAAVLDVIHEALDNISNVRWRSAANAAFRRPAERYLGQSCDSLAGRWKSAALEEGTTEGELAKRQEAYRGYWISAANHLAEAVERQFDNLNRLADGWSQYRKSEPPAPPPSLPISFDRTDVLYRFEGNRGVQCISYRWLTAHADVDHYDAVGWYYNQPDAPVEIVPLANCVLAGPMRDLPQGGRSGTLKFERTVHAGEAYFFAYMTCFHSEQPCRPTILYEVRGLSMRSLIVRAQFDVAALPIKLWSFEVEAQDEGWEIPEDEAPGVLTVGSNGYAQSEYPNCERGRKYGLRWLWGDNANL